MNFRQKCITVVMSLGLGLFLALALGEIVMRLHTPAGMRLRNNQIILPRNQVYTFKNTGIRGCDALIIHHKNSLGFRGPELPADFKNTLTLIAVGGSTTECFYLSDGHSWPERLGTQLAADFPRVWVNNAGLDGHSTFGHIILVRDILAQLHPNVILFLVGVNDIARDDLAGFDRTLLKSSETALWRKALRSVAEKSRMIAWLENLARAFTAWKRGLGHHSLDLEKLPHLNIPDSSAQALLQTHQTKYLDGYRDRLRMLVHLCRDAQIQPIFITQPSLYGKGRDAVTGVNLETLQITADMNGRLAWRVLELYNDVTRQVAREEHIPLIDLAHELPKTSFYFYDFYHFTNAGAEAVADVLHPELAVILKR